MTKIELTNTEYTYLINSSCLPSMLRTIVEKKTLQIDDAYLLTITEEQADEIRDLCGEQLQLTGFHEHYYPTPEGVILETLIDKFFSD